MKKFILLIVALAISLVTFAQGTITYNLNGGVTNDYGWKNKGDMFAAFMTDNGATEFETLDYYKAQTDPLGSPNICTKLTTCAAMLNDTAKWGWLKIYIQGVHTAQAADGASALDETCASAAWRYAAGAFFIDGQRATWPKSADFSVAGTLEAFQPTWKHGFCGPTTYAEGEIVLLPTPYKEGEIFFGWYKEADFSGEKVTEISGTGDVVLYAKFGEYIPTLKKGEQAVFFENTSNWSGDINAYLWADDGAIQWVGTWPGEACTYLGYNVWKWTYTGSETIYGGLIFNSPSTGKQTADFEFVNGGYYDANGYVKTIAPSEDEEIDTVQTVVYVAGSHTEWALTEDNLMQQSGDSIYSIVYENMPAGSYEFKLVVNSYWIGAEEFDSLNSTPGVVCLLGGNISFTLDQSADVTICYNLASRAITILAEGIDRFGKFEVEYYSICGSSAIFGEEFLTDAYREKIDDFKMIEENGIYTKTLYSIALVADVEYRYKVAANGTWNEGQFPQVGDMLFSVSQSGLYDLTFTYIPDSAYLNVDPVLIPTIELPTIAEVIAMADETETKVQGTVTYVAGSNFWIQDATGGILCYGKNNGLVEGELVTLSGVKTIYKGSPELNNATVVAKEVGTEVVAEPLSIAEVLAEDTFNVYLNEVVYIEGVTISKYEGEYKTPYITDGNNEIALYKWDGVTEDKFPVGSKVSVKAVLAIYNETLQLRGRVEWIEVAEKGYYTLNVSTNYPNYASVEIQDNVGYNDNEATIFAYTNYIDLRFVRWSDGSTENPRTITLTSDTTLIAEFELCWAIMTYSVDETKGTITGGGQFDEGDSTTITAIPAEGYMFDYFAVYNYGNGSTTKVSFNPMVFDYINGNYQIVAYFKQIPVLIDGLYYYLTDRLDGITVRFYNSAWSQVNIWAWNENGNLFETWPGVPMNNEGNGWWSYTFDPSIENINVVFNDGGNGYQTADVEGITGNMCYGYAGDFEVPYVEDCGLLNEPKATVTYAYEGEYSGAIVVPDEVVYNNKTYKVTSIEERVFAGRQITSLSITNNITYLPELNLYGCYDLTQLKAHADLIDNISNLRTINIEELYVTGGYMEWINKADFPSLKVLDLSATENYDLAYGFFKGEEYDYNYEGFAGLRKLVLPNNLNTIYDRQFRELWSLEEIVIPDGVTEIPEAAFYDCHALSNVTLSKNLTSIGNYAFYSCHALENIVIPEGVTEIGNAAFYGCTYLEGIEMPSTLEEVGNNAFALCSKVKSIKVKAHTPPTLWAKTFYEVDRNTPVYVAEVAYNDYVADQYWGEFFNIIPVSESGTPTGVANSDATSIVIYTQNGMLYIEGAETDYHVLDAAGRLIYTGRDAQLQLPRGVYMIAVGGEVQKVVL